MSDDKYGKRILKIIRCLTVESGSYCVNGPCYFNVLERKLDMWDFWLSPWLLCSLS